MSGNDSIHCSIQLGARTQGGPPEVVVREGGRLQVYPDGDAMDFCLFFNSIDDVRALAAAAEAAVAGGLTAVPA